MGENLIGQFYALMTAVTWACAVILFKLSGDKLRPLSLNFFKNTVGMILLILTVVATKSSISQLSQLPLRDFLILIASGVLGIAVADTLFFRALNLIGVGIMSIVDCMYSPFAILFGFLMLGEKLIALHYVGGVLILIGVLISSGHAPPKNRTRGQLILGILLATISMATVAFSVIWIKPILTDSGIPLVWATLIRMAASTVVIAIWVSISKHRKEHWSVFRPSSVWKVSIPGAVLGAYLSMVLWLAGFKYTTWTAVAALLNQTSVIFCLILASIFLKETFTRRKLVSVTLALTGVVVVVLADVIPQYLSAPVSGGS